MKTGELGYSASQHGSGSMAVVSNGAFLMDGAVPPFKMLKERHREIRDDLPQNLSLRIHRALSWLDCAEQKDDDDSKFIFLWVAFNAAYGHEIEDRWGCTEKKILRNFLKILIEADDAQILYGLSWREFSGPFRSLIDNQFVYQKYWEFQKGNLSEAEWLNGFEQDRSAANCALDRMDTEKFLMIVFERLSTLRNQLIHGSATWNSSVNRNQIRDGSKIMGRVVPAIVSIMLDNNPGLMGSPAYPVISSV
jgi:hypothetical protein